MSSSQDSNNEIHNLEIFENIEALKRKRSLEQEYLRFYGMIHNQMDHTLPGLLLEIGSGMGLIKQVIPECITSDQFANPWLDRVEDVYSLSFKNSSVSHVIMFDVWHHLEYPANALAELHRVLIPKGRLILFEPSMSLLGRFIYGLFHHEPLGLKTPLNVGLVPPSALERRYFAAQSSSHRLFRKKEAPAILSDWNVLHSNEICSFSYFGTGGFKGPKLYPDALYPVMRTLDRMLNFTWPVFAARSLYVLEKRA